MSNYHYGQFGPEHLENSKEGVLLFNQQKYWECHEVLEDHWLEGRGDNARYVYWAIIQVAAAMIHYRDGNLNGARGLLSKAKEKFNKIDEFKVGTDLLEKNLEWKRLKDEVFAIPKDAELDKFSDLFEFRFKDPAKWELL